MALNNSTNGSGANGKYAAEAHDLNIYYGGFHAVRDIDLMVERQKITALIGPSGCGKSTVLRAFNRMNDLIPIARTVGNVYFHGKNIYDPDVDAVEVRRRVGMVFQKPNPFPTMSIRHNVMAGPRLQGLRRRSPDHLVERALRQAALWDEVKDILDRSGVSLSGGQQQRLCIARALALEPEILLMDEPCSALDPIATAKIEDLIHDLRKSYTVVIVTHNMQQAARVADFTAFFYLGELIEYDKTDSIFRTPRDNRTEAYITGRFG